MYTLNSTSMRRSQHVPQKQQEQHPLRQITQVPLPHEAADVVGGLKAPLFAPESIGGNASPALLGTAHSAGVEVKWSPSPVAPTPPPPVGMNTYGLGGLSSTTRETPTTAGKDPLAPGISLRQQRVQEELAQEKLRVQQEIALQQQRIQQQQQSMLRLSQRQGDERGLIQQLAQLQQLQQLRHRVQDPPSLPQQAGQPELTQQQQLAQQLQLQQVRHRVQDPPSLPQQAGQPELTQQQQLAQQLQLQQVRHRVQDPPSLPQQAGQPELTQQQQLAQQLQLQQVRHRVQDPPSLPQQAGQPELTQQQQLAQQLQLQQVRHRVQDPPSLPQQAGQPELTQQQQLAQQLQLQQVRHRVQDPPSLPQQAGQPELTQQQQLAQQQQQQQQRRRQKVQSLLMQEGVSPSCEQWVHPRSVAHPLPQSAQQGGARRGNRDYRPQRQQQALKQRSMGLRREPISEAAGGHKTGSGDNGKDSPSGVNGAEAAENLLPSLSDEEFVQKFKSLYSLQADDEGGVEHLRAQESTTLGVVGTLDVDMCRQLIEDHDVTIVVTDTGTGKSTLIPKAILDGHPDAKVANAQPRRTPAIKLAQRVAALYGEKVGNKVGYWVRGEHVGTLGETPIMYVTNYTLFLHLLHNSPNDIGVTHVIFDEFHERTTEVEVLFLMMKLVMLRNPGKLRLVLCSATAEVSKWTCFFENLTVAEYSKANPMYPIHDYYLEDVSKLIGITFVEPNSSPTGVVQSVQLHTIILMMKEMLKFLAAIAAPQHSILVFVPGRTVVEQLSLWIRNNLGDQLDPIPWYRDIELAFIQEALQRESVTKKKVYVATDIAEVSLTLPDVVFVIDSGTAKRPHIIETNPNSVAFPPLELVWESSVNLLQRRGRIGRVQQGFFFTLLSRKQAQQLSPNESRLGNAVLHEIVLHCLHLTPSPFLMFSLCREKPRKVSVELSLSTLCDGGYIVPEGDHGSLIEAIDNTIHHRVKDAWSALIANAYASRKDDNDVLGFPLAQHRFNLSLRGLIVGGLPFGVEPGTIVFSGLIMGLTTLSIIAASCVSCNTPFYVPYNATDKLQRLQLLNRVEEFMRRFKGEYYNDALSAVGAVLAYMAMQREGISEEGQNAWCEERYLSRARIVDILLVVKQTKEQLAAIVPFEDITDVDELMEQYNENALTLSFICSAAHMHHGIYVLFDAGVAQKKGYAGSGVFVNINCCRDRSVPTTCPWERDTVCIPFTVQTVYGRLLGSFSSQLKPEVFNIMLLLLSSRFVYEEIHEDAESVTFEVAQSGSCVYINSDRITALQLLQIRRLMCARLCVMHFLMQREGGPSDNDAIAEHLRKTGSDFGIPPGMEQHPHLLSVMITSFLKKVVQRIEATIAAKGNEREPGGAANSQPFCRVTGRPAEFHPTRQSAIVFSSNGCAPYECPAGGMRPVYRDPHANLIA